MNDNRDNYHGEHYYHGEQLNASLMVSGLRCYTPVIGKITVVILVRDRFPRGKGDDVERLWNELEKLGTSMKVLEDRIVIDRLCELFYFNYASCVAYSDIGNCNQVLDGSLNDTTLPVNTNIRSGSGLDSGFPSLVDTTGTIHTQDGAHGIHSHNCVNEENMNDGTKVGPTLAGNNLGMSSYAKLVTGEKIESIRAISERFTNTTYGFFLGKHVAYLVVANYVRNTWGKYGLVKSLLNSSTGLFSFQFSSMDGLDSMLENYVSNVPVWVKPHGVPVTTFSEDSLSSIAIDCFELIVELKDTIVVAMPNIVGEDFYTCNIREECPKNIGSGEAKNLKKPSQNPKGVLFGPKVGFKPAKQVFRPDSKKPTANTSENKKKNMEPTKEVSKSNPFDVLNSVKNDVDLGTCVGTSNLASKESNSSGSSFWNGKPLEKVDSSRDYDSEDEVASVENEIASFLAKKDGYGTNSLLEQWKDPYKNANYDYEPYDDDMYEGQEVPKKSSQFVFLSPRKLFAYLTGRDLHTIEKVMAGHDETTGQTPNNSTANLNKVVSAGSSSSIPADYVPAGHNRKYSGRCTSHHNHHHKEDLKITFEESWNDSSEDDHEETCLMAVGSPKAHQNHRPQIDSWNAYITKNEVALQSSIMPKPYAYHYNDIGEVPPPSDHSIIESKWTFQDTLDENGVVSLNHARSTCEILCDEFVEYMRDKFKRNKLGDLKSILNLQITQGDNGIFILESRYLRNYLKKFDLENAKTTKTPMSTDLKLTLDKDEVSVDISKYRCIEAHVYADSDHAGDYVDRKSTSGVCTLVGECLTQWCCKKQTALTISTTEAEYVAAGRACQQALWMRQVIKDYDT
ncbi:hypothetical protein Tco_0655150 [Tanacetum coccineum]|uniref:Uncharacterized protein n=1 Tax=Tanacetum coccineum TaxID=301880 RepID=A0ABQ4X5C8_9ASTR